MDLTSHSLLERVCQHSDEAAWTRLVELYSPFLRGIFARQGIPSIDIDDLTQEVFTVLLGEMPRFEHSGRPGAFRHWLRGVVVNRMRAYWRRRNHDHLAQGTVDWMTQLDTLEDSSSDLSRAWDREHNQHVVSRVLDLVRPGFSVSTWQAFRRHVIEGLSVATVAMEMGLSSNAILIAKSRVLRRLREEIAGLTD